jgi:hypothetical protein
MAMIAARVIAPRTKLASNRPRPTSTYRRLETLIGEEAQIDWGTFGTVRTGRGSRSVSGFVMVLSALPRHARAVYGKRLPSPPLSRRRRCSLDRDLTACYAGQARYSAGRTGPVFTTTRG